jgi:hypothetical protein
MGVVATHHASDGDAVLRLDESGFNGKPAQCPYANPSRVQHPRETAAMPQNNLRSPLRAVWAGPLETNPEPSLGRTGPVRVELARLQGPRALPVASMLEVWITLPKAQDGEVSL